MYFLLRPGRGAVYCDQPVCLSVRKHISGTAGPIFTKCCVQIPVTVIRSSFGGVAMLCTSDFMDDVTFGRNRPYGDYSGGKIGPTGSESDVYECLVSNC